MRGGGGRSENKRGDKEARKKEVAERRSIKRKKGRDW